MCLRKIQVRSQTADDDINISRCAFRLTQTFRYVDQIGAEYSGNLSKVCTFENGGLPARLGLSMGLGFLLAVAAAFLRLPHGARGNPAAAARSRSADLEATAPLAAGLLHCSIGQT